MQMDLWSDASPSRERLGDGAWLLRGFALPNERALWAGVLAVTEMAPLRHMTTPGGHAMSVSTASCGRFGWVTDETGYRYQTKDPVSEQQWPAMPSVFLDLARRAAASAGYASFQPDACLINRYAVGAKMGLHQDRNERDMHQPIVSVSLGLPATFLFGGRERTDAVRKIRLCHGDVAVWGGASRLCFHGILPLAMGTHPLTGDCRVNLTFRKAS